MSKQEKSVMANKLFTFGENQLTIGLKGINKEKFPFMKNGKGLKRNSYKNVLIQQRKAKHLAKIPSQYLSKNQIASKEQTEQEKALEFTFYKKKEKDLPKEKKQTALPKVFRTFSLSQSKRRSNSKKETPVSQGSLRYENQETSITIRPFESEEKQKNIEKGLQKVNFKSLMLISSQFQEIPEGRFKTLQNQIKNRRIIKCKSTNDRQILKVAPKFEEDFEKFKKIYS